MSPPFPPHQQEAKASQPGEGSLHHPPLAVAAKVWLPPRPGQGVLPPGDAGLDTPRPQPSPQGLAVIALVCHQLAGPTPGPGHPNPLQRLLDPSHLAPLGARHQYPQGKALPLYDHHHLASLPSAGEPHRLSPLLAGTKVASKKALSPTGASLPRPGRQGKPGRPSPRPLAPATP